jgi:hypothetical protein
MRWHRILRPLFLIVLLVVLCAAAIVAQVSPEDQLAAAETKWIANKPKAYEFTLKLICFCPPVPPGQPGSEPIVFRVENGVGSLTGAWAARPEARQGLEKYSTAEKQFAFIRAELGKRPYRVEIEYDEDLGYPRRVYIDAKHIADAEYGFTVEGFRALAQ